MPTFEYICPDHGYFEVFFESRHEFHPCPKCAKDSEQVYFSFPQLDKTAAGFWDNYHDDRVGTFTDKKKYREAVERAGYRIKEPGSDEAALRAGQQWVDKRKEELKERVGKFFQERTLDEIRRGIAIDKEILDAQQAGDENKIKRMGGVTTLDDAYKGANS